MEPIKGKSRFRPKRSTNQNSTSSQIQDIDTGNPSPAVEESARGYNPSASAARSTKHHHGTRRKQNTPPRVDTDHYSREPVTLPGEQLNSVTARPRARKYPQVKDRSEGDLADRITREIRRGYECMVCMASIRISQPTWNCSTCWALFHLKCTHEWIKRNTPSSRLPGSKWEWRCPGCQYVYIESELPAYKCFCGRVDNPESSRQYTAHSCGEPCSRKRSDCDHPCVLSCHPGPCPPCTALLPRSVCFSHPNIKAGSAYVRCGDLSAKPHSCGSVCKKPLECGKHACILSCHEGQCAKCVQIVGRNSCYCGTCDRPMTCSEASSGWSCDTLCTKMFSCGIHHCTRTCHEGSCGPCPDDPAVRGNTCECSKTVLTQNTLSRTRCTDTIPTCEKICARLAPCGHSCESTCHHGDCLPCTIVVTQTCRCCRSRRSVACTRLEDDFKCEQVCRTLKSCSKHKCDVVCCPQYGRKDFAAENHLCLQVCNKALNCGFHNCDEICHLGKCKPCRVVLREPLRCGCGTQMILPPIACGTPPPPCFSICNKPLPNCEHKCLSMCHPGPCSPCPVLVPKMCSGDHRALPAVPCYVQSVSCGAKCGKSLPCKRHACARTCHSGDCLNGLDTCKQPCETRRDFCEHDCGMNCHDGSCASDEPCRARILVSCPCGLRTEESTCRSCESNPNPIPQQIQCTLECQTAQRQACLRQAFKPDDIDLSEAEQYSGDLVTQAEKYDRFLRIIDSMLLDASENRTRALHLPTTDVPRRWLTIEYAQIHYRFDTVVVREGDGLHVVVQFVPGQTRTPKPTLSAMLDMMPSQALKYTIDFDNDGPKIHLYDVARGYGRLTSERVHEALRDFRGTYRTRRGEGFDMFVDFVDANKAVAAYRKLQTTPGLEQCRLLNVHIFDSPTPDPQKPISSDSIDADVI